MNKNHKIKKYQEKQYNCRYKYWWVVCVYLFVPIILMLFFDKVFTPLLQNFMVSARIEEGYALNARYAIDNVIYPFIESFMIIIGIVVSYVILRLFQKELLMREMYFAEVKKCLKYFEIVTVLLAVIIAVYSKTNNFDYSQYGYSIDTIKKAAVQEDGVIPLEKIPSIHSIGIRTKEKNLLYDMLLRMSQFGFYLWDNLEMIVAIAAAVIIPLKSYSEKIEGRKNGT